MINLVKKYSLVLASILLLFNFTISNALADDDDHKAGKRFGWLSCTKLQKKLDLDEDQQEAWANAQSEIKELHDKYMPMFKEEKGKIKETLKAEADKDEPDLAVLFSAGKDMKKDFTKFRNKAQKIQLDVYDELNADQKQIVFEKVAKKKMKMMMMMKDHKDMKMSDDDDDNSKKKKKKGWW